MNLQISKKLTFNKMELSYKIALSVLTVLTMIFIVFIGFTGTYVKNVINSLVQGELSTLSKANAMQIQAILDNANSLAVDLQDYCISILEEQDNPSPKDVSNQTFYSRIYTNEISEKVYKSEEFIYEAAKRGVKSNEDVFGVGVFFELYKFDKALESYAFYLCENTLENDKLEPFAHYNDYSKEEYYTNSKNLKENSFTKPYLDQGITMISATYPILYKDTFQGVITADINVTNFNKINISNSKYPSLYCSILDSEGTVIYDSWAAGEDCGKSVSEFMKPEDFETLKSNFKQNKSFQVSFENPVGDILVNYYYPIDAGSSTWWASTVVTSKDANRTIVNTVGSLILLSLVALLFISITTIMIVKKLIKPIGTVVDAAKGIAQGNFNIALHTTREDEIGILTNTFAETAQQLKAVIEDIRFVLHNMANKNLNVHPSIAYPGDLVFIKEAMENSILNFNLVLQQINQASIQVSDGSKDVAQSSTELAQGATEQASVIEEFIASTEEISQNIIQNIEQVNKTSHISKVAEQHAHKGVETMDKMLVSMEEISQSSKNISNIVKIIDSIANQTNLLALNASIEAARAGDAGKGFAVVANEIRGLATSSSEIVKEIEAVVEEGLSKTETGQEMAHSAAKVLEEIVTAVNETAKITTVLLENSEQQKITIKEIVQGTNQLSTAVESTASASQESAAISQELAVEADQLKKLIEDFNLKV